MSESGMIYSVEETLRIQTVKLNQQLNKLLEQNTQIIELTAERDKALAQNAELAATVVVLSSKLKEVAALVDGDGFSAVQWILDNHADVGQLAIALPQQNLRKVQAEAGRVGFVAGYNQAQSDPFTANDTEIDLYADEYAASVKAGE